MPEKSVLEIDVGGSKIRAGKDEFRTPRTKKEFIALLKKFSGAGKIKIGAAGAVSGTKVVFSSNIRYLKGFDFRKIFPDAVLCVDNDARVFLRKKLETWKSDFPGESWLSLSARGWGGLMPKTEK